MTASEALRVLGEEVERFYQGSEDPTTEPVTLDLLSTVLQRTVERLEAERVGA